MVARLSWVIYGYVHWEYGVQARIISGRFNILSVAMSASKNRISILRLFKSTSDSTRHPKQWGVKSRYKCHLREFEAWQPITGMAISFQALFDRPSIFQPLTAPHLPKNLDLDFPPFIRSIILKFRPFSSSISPLSPSSPSPTLTSPCSHSGPPRPTPKSNFLRQIRF